MLAPRLRLLIPLKALAFAWARQVSIEAQAAEVAQRELSVERAKQREQAKIAAAMAAAEDARLAKEEVHAEHAALVEEQRRLVQKQREAEEHVAGTSRKAAELKQAWADAAASRCGQNGPALKFSRIFSQRIRTPTRNC